MYFGNGKNYPVEVTTSSYLEADFDVRKYVRMLWRRRYIVLLLFVLIFGFSTYRALTQKVTPVYRSTVYLEVDEKETNIRLLPQFSSVRQQSIYWGSPEGKIIAEVLSTSVIEEVVQMLDLDKAVHSISPNLSFSMTNIQSHNAPLGTYRVHILDNQHYVVYDTANRELGRGISGVPFQHEFFEFTISNIEGPPQSEFYFTLYPLQRAVNSVRAATHAQATTRAAIQDNVAGGGIAGAASAKRSRKDAAIQDAGIVQVDVYWQDPETATQIANALADVIRHRELEDKRLEHTKTREYIERQLNTYTQKLKASEEALQTYKEQNRIYELDAIARDVTYKVFDIEAEISQIQAERERIKLFREKVTSGLQPEDYLLISAIPFQDEEGYGYWDVLSQLTSQLMELEIQLPLKLEEMTENHPDIIALKNQIQQVRLRLQQQVDARLTMLDSREESLRLQLLPYQQQLETFPLKEVELARLEREFRLNEEIYSLLTRQHEQTRLAEAAIVNDIQVLDYASIPTAPIGGGPNRQKAILLGALLGIGVGLGVAFLLEFLDNTIRETDEIERHIQLPVYGMIPQIESIKNGRRTHKAKARFETLVTHLAPKSIPSEAFRSLRTNIQFFDLSRQSEAILITSAVSEEGKSTTCANLAITTAQVGRKTLLIDGDLRKPVIHHLFEAPSEPGLTDVLLGRYTWQEVIHSTSVPGLDIICSGTQPPNPSELLSSPELKSLITTLKEHYDMILFDSPPVIPVADSVALSTNVDGVLLVVSAGKTDRHALQRTRDLLHNVNARIMGAVLNNVRINEIYGYQKHYYYYDTKKPVKV
ncbi:MAG: polysaccharide biosynthesis tyrosine autokinase [Gemmatimonadetes bacterium]|nr:MAG: polysaccharide biosynthesis tyrosine autokinase [Gemmatimonadota bacterium]